MIGQVGLNIDDPGPFLRVDLSAIATINVTDTGETVLIIFIVRGTLTTDLIVYSGIVSVGSLAEGTSTIVELVAEGSDYNVPPPPSSLLVYSVFISSSTLTERVGPESFKATAYSD